MSLRLERLGGGGCENLETPIEGFYGGHVGGLKQ